MDNFKVLIVDDDSFLLTITEKALKKADYDVKTANDGDQALLLLSEYAFDVVITDLVMPGEVDGIGILDAAKAADNQTEVILITGYASVDSAVTAMKKGAADYLQKPVNFEELKIRLEKIRHVKALVKETNDLREAMDVTENRAGQTIRDLEMMVANLQKRLAELERVGSEE